MRFTHADGTVVHLSYCTNVHPAEDLDGVLEQVRRFAVPVRAALGADRLGLGLWLASDVAAVLAGDAGQVERLRATLTDQSLEVVTLNGFPYGRFHAPEVKREVYRPDWSQRARVDYTLALATVLSGLLPDGVARGSISTLPLGWRAWWDEPRRHAAQRHLAEVAAALDALEARTGKAIRIGLEPEPGCVLETTGEARAYLGELNQNRIGICLDTCHLAVAFEDPDHAVTALAAAGVPVVKVQASAALHVEDPDSPDARRALAGFTEPRFLHQVRQRRDGDLAARDDLDDALSGAEPLTGGSPWRVHFHVPLHAEPAPPLASTAAHLDAALGTVLGGDRALTEHVEVETYTWSVLPAGARPDGDGELADGIAQELAWTRDRLVGHGIKAQP